ncbi:hypothetical protein GCM10023116_39700 [Kistimonas scapharcae]|uniref:Mu-like prophage FluMu N-terminal domain-containing protein n=1 Tax=Kistimonas scapharcae TaxID=1036133 RepID=A0ABP8V720_9GAMM
MTDKPAPAKKAPEKKAPAKQPATKVPAKADTDKPQDQVKPGSSADQPAVKTPAPAKSDKHQVTVRSTDKRDFFRCGIRFTPDGVTVALTDEQLARIKAEPRLVVEE